jgi:hypothetical protein
MLEAAAHQGRPRGVGVDVAAWNSHLSPGHHWIHRLVGACRSWLELTSRRADSRIVSFARADRLLADPH